MSRVFPDPFIPGLASADQAEHLIVPWAACDSPQWWDTVTALPSTATTHLRSLLKGMRRIEHDRGQASSLNLAHERVLARELGWSQLPDGLLPWAALSQVSDRLPDATACGWITLCHWAMGREQATLSDPQWLHISADQSQTLMAAMLPFFESEGIELQHIEAGRWLARGQALNAPTASLERVIGRDVEPWLPASQASRLLRRLQNEMQMLLYTHPVNEERASRGELAINSIWFSGTGALPDASARTPAVHMPHTLAQAALADDWLAYAQAWTQLDEQAVRPLLERQQAGQTVQLTLCGERGAITLQSVPPSLWQRVHQMLSPSLWPAVLKDQL